VPAVVELRPGPEVILFWTILENLQTGLEIPVPDANQFPQAYGLTVAFRTPKEQDLAYAAVKAVTAAAQPRKSDGVARERYLSGLAEFEVAVAIVITDQQLFLASLGTDGQLVLKEQPAVVLHVADSPRRERVFILSENGVGDFLKRLRQTIDAFRAAFSRLDDEKKLLIWHEIGEKLPEPDY
jgi:hypothetical protein